jgi:hypothetical protein
MPTWTCVAIARTLSRVKRMRDRLTNAAERGDALRAEDFGESRQRACIVRVRALPRPRAVREGRLVAVPLLSVLLDPSAVSVKRLSVLRLRVGGLARAGRLMPLVVYDSAAELPLLLDVLGLRDRVMALPLLACPARRGAGVSGNGEAMCAPTNVCLFPIPPQCRHAAPGSVWAGGQVAWLGSSVLLRVLGWLPVRAVTLLRLPCTREGRCCSPAPGRMTAATAETT